MDLGLLVQVLIRMSPLLLVAVAIGGQVYWLDRRDARKRRAEEKAKLLAGFLVILEDELYRTLKKGAEGSRHTYRTYILGATPGRATILYRMFDELGGAKALSLEKAGWWERTLKRLADKLGFDMEVVPGIPGCKHLVGFNRIQSIEERLEELE